MKKEKIISTVLALATITNMSGCTKIDDTNTQKITSKVESEPSTMTAYMELYDNEMDYTKIINDYLINNKDLSSMEYKKAVYMLLSNTDTPMNVYLEELRTLLMLNINPSCNESFNELFANLINAAQSAPLDATIKYEIARLYLPLAAYYHELECNDQSHLENYNPDEDIYSCTNLEELLEEYNKRSR